MVHSRNISYHIHSKVHLQMYDNYICEMVYSTKAVHGVGMHCAGATSVGSGCSFVSCITCTQWTTAKVHLRMDLSVTVHVSKKFMLAGTYKP